MGQGLRFRAYIYIYTYYIYIYIYIYIINIYDSGSQGFRVIAVIGDLGFELVLPRGLAALLFSVIRTFYGAVGGMLMPFVLLHQARQTLQTSKARARFSGMRLGMAWELDARAFRFGKG